MNAPSQLPIAQAYDIPLGWGTNKEEFRSKVLELVYGLTIGGRAPKFDIANADGSTTPFYPVLTAISPEWNVISREELRKLMRQKLEHAAMQARERSKTRYADHAWGAMYLAWWIQQGLFTDDELAEIRFDHDETPETYAELHSGGKDCLEESIDWIVHPRCDLDELRWQTALSAMDACWCDCDCIGH